MPKRGCRGYREIAGELRREWLAGWVPGLRLPPYVELCQRFGTTPVTMQRAMDLLVEQGFVVTRPPVGAFLAERPPHTCQVGLVFPGHPGDIKSFGWSLNYLANLQVAQELNAAQGRWRIRFYMDASAEVGSKGLARLLGDVADGVLAGLIFNYSPHDLKEHPLITRPPLPIVHYNPKYPAPGMGIQAMTVPPLRAGLEWACRQGRRDIAVLTPQNIPVADVRADLAACGLSWHPERVFGISPYQLDWVAGAIAALFCADGRRHPDALVITDDHLVEPAVTALTELAPPGLDRLAIFAHWNFPLPYRGALPIARFGHDAHAWLGAGLDLIARHPEPSRGRGEVATIAQRLEEGAAARPARSAQSSFDHLYTQAREVLLCAAN